MLDISPTFSVLSAEQEIVLPPAFQEQAIAQTVGGSPATTNTLQSPGFQSAVTGWKLGSNGSFEAVAPAISGLDTVVYASTISLDITKRITHKTTTVNATGNATINASAAGNAGEVMHIIITNDATSGKTITFGTNFKPNGTLVGTANKTATLIFVTDGINWYEASRITGL